MHSEVHMVFGYIDPASGSMVIQVLIGGLLALPFFFRRQLARVVSAIRRDQGELTDRRR
jgi:hypothetical protein